MKVRHLSSAAGIAAALSIMAAGHAQPVPDGEARRFAAPLFVSPAGKVFRRGDKTGNLVESWFREADADADGALTLAEFRQDFAGVFKTLDSDADGEIEPDEVTVYERDILPEMASLGPSGGGRMMIRGGPGGGGGGAGGGGGRTKMRRPGNAAGGPPPGAARFGLLPIPHPVMAADRDMNRGITLQEYERAADDRFMLLDEKRTGRLLLEDLLARRAQPRRAGQ